MISKYFNPYTDFGFKKLFGEEGSKDLLIDFLNQLLPTQHQIAKLSFKNPENFSNTVEERKAIFDIYCESASGERFIVEMQKAKMHFFVIGDVPRFTTIVSAAMKSELKSLVCSKLKNQWGLLSTQNIQRNKCLTLRNPTG